MRFPYKAFISTAVTFSIATLITSCSPKNIVYLQDIRDNVPVELQENGLLTFKPGDRLNIMVYSRDHDVADLFNLTYANSNGGHGYNPYTVDSKGDIDMPILGYVNVVGKTREELASVIKHKLLTSKMVLDPTVNVEYADLSFFVLGEVSSPGRVLMTKDKINILEGIALAGDLKIEGQRANIMVLRTVDGKQIPYRVDLTSAESIYRSPVFYLEQNDIIYVEPNERRRNSATLNGNTIRTPAFWASTASFAMSLILYFSRFSSSSK